MLLSALVGVWFLVGPARTDRRIAPRAQSEAAEITVAALGAVRPQLQGTAAVDASRLCRAALADWDCPAPVRQAFDRLRLTPTSRGFTQVCPSGEGSCRLVGVRHLLIPGPPQRRGAGAQVRIDLVSDAGSGRLAESRRVVHLVRQQDRWSVVRVDEIR